MKVHMTRKRILTVLTLLVGLPALAGAQEQPRGPARIQVGPRAFSFNFNRGRIGVVVKAEADSATDKIGARIEGVTAGGPAEKAGLKVGDIVTRFNGVSLAGADTEDEDRSGPGSKLVRLAQALDPGDTVRVDYRRGTENRSATLVAEDVQNGVMALSSRSLRGGLMVDPDIRYRLDEHGPGFAYEFGLPWMRLELVRMNADLAEYFGTSEGLLVVRAPEGEDLPLKGGDVILTIDARKPTSAAHAMRILRSYDEGESVKIDVMRKQKRVTVTWTVLTQEDRLRRSKARKPGGERT
jgi:S1-C subfamily serine protease